MKREFGFLMDDAKTRYINFLRDYEPFAERIKQRDIASYLGITPETLSRNKVCSNVILDLFNNRLSKAVIRG
jgi:hypothetical protein